MYLRYIKQLGYYCMVFRKRVKAKHIKGHSKTVRTNILLKSKLIKGSLWFQRYILESDLKIIW